MGAAFAAIAALPLAASTCRVVFLRPQVAPTQVHFNDQYMTKSLEAIAAVEFADASQAWDGQRLESSIKLFRRSAQLGHEVGEYCFRYGQYHELAPSDIPQAMRWYKRGMRMLHGGCTTMLGKLHMAMGLRRHAQELLSRTARPQSAGGFAGESGDSLAQWFLAEMSLQKGELRDAVRWWKRSAENGDVDAMMRLVEVFSDGALGIPKESTRAEHWLLAAAAHGHQDALARVEFTDVNRSSVEKAWIEAMEKRGWF